MEKLFLIGNAYWTFALLVTLVAFCCYRRTTARQQFLMGLCGAVGGVFVSQWYRPHFWNPPSVLDTQMFGLYVAIEDMVFGTAFTVIVTVLCQLFAGQRLILAGRQEPSSKKVFVLVAALVATILCYRALGWNPIWATSVGFLAGAATLYALRPDLGWVGLLGAFLTLGLYTFVVGAFVLLAPNRTELATSICRFYVTHGPWMTTLALGIFALSYGALIAPLYPFIANKQLVAIGR